ncbi:cupin domain-containing protein [Flavobacteriaceae bacterium]|jgi:quercetin dioxygenase-like cupin family protein|nr:cupin domain-containing protein [Flavobacteriaceae bacterium]
MKRIICLVLIGALSMSCAVKKQTVTVTKLAETSQSWNGDVLPDYPAGNPLITVLKITIPPKTKLKKHYHPVINSGIVIKGKLTVIDIDNNVLDLKPGEVIVELVNKIHYGINKGRKPVEIIVFYAGTKDLPITVLSDN